MTALAAPAFTKPWPLVSLRRDRSTWLPWLGQNAHRVALMLVVAALATHAVVPVYFVAFETHIPLPFLHSAFPTVHPLNTTELWHHVMSSKFQRHAWRNIPEGLVGGTVALAVGWNRFGKRRQRALAKPPNWFDRLEMWLRIPNLKDNEYRARLGLPARSIPQSIATPFLVILYGLLPIWFMISVFGGLHPSTAHISGSGWANTEEKFWANDYWQKIVGFLAAPIARRPAGPAIDDQHGYYGQKRVVANRPVHLWQKLLIPATYWARVTYEREQGVTSAQTALDERSGWIVFLRSLGLFIFVVAIASGYYILYHYASS